jgi:hypothetical protein
MPLLPQSRRGTGLLAGAVWLAACTAPHQLIFPQPRSTGLARAAVLGPPCHGGSICPAREFEARFTGLPAARLQPLARRHPMGFGSVRP